ncbi:MAG: glutaminase, partial [Rhodospirillales bacterium]|nr:glutaminase [Rhodospirillales bacterium]
AATLANGGVHPLTGTVAMGRPEVRSILSVMSSCGMYDFSGEWCFRVGLPAKSGVSGGIIAALPGQFGIGVYSPLLDAQGNSVRGIAACDDLCRHFDLHVYEVRRTGSTVIRRELDGTTLRSKRQRPSWQQRILDARGGEIVTFALQGDLFFAAMEFVCRRIFEPEREMRYLVLDGHRVGRIDGSARALIEEVREALRARGVCLLLAGFSPPAGDLLRAGTGEPWPEDAFFACTDDALEWCEDRIIEESEPQRAGGDELLPLGALDLTAGCSPEDAAVLGDLVSRVDYRDGETIVREGDEARELFILAAGAASVRVRLGHGGRCKRVGAIEPGVTFGEFALFENSRRIADVIAAGAASCYVLPVERLTALAVDNPSLHARLLRNIMRGMADRLRRATDEIRALED